MSKLKNNIAVITGATGGIGYQVAKKLGHEGYTVILNGIESIKGEELVKELTSLGIIAEYYGFDVTDEKAVKDSVKKVDDLLNGQKLSGLVNNAGIGVLGAIQNLTSEEFKYQFDVNLLGVFHCTQAYLDLLGADKNRTGAPGKIINISSISGEIGMPFMSAYNMSKFGLEGFSEAIRRELMLFGIDVVVIAPGPVKTPIWKKFNKDDKQFSACASQMLVKQFLLDQKINPYFFNKVNSNNLSYKHYASTAKGRFLQIYNK